MNAGNQEKLLHYILFDKMRPLPKESDRKRDATHVTTLCLSCISWKSKALNLFEESGRKLKRGNKGFGEWNRVEEGGISFLKLVLPATGNHNV